MNCFVCDGITAFAMVVINFSALGPNVPLVCIANGMNKHCCFATIGVWWSLFSFSAFSMLPSDLIRVMSVTMPNGCVLIRMSGRCLMPSS